MPHYPLVKSLTALCTGLLCCIVTAATGFADTLAIKDAVVTSGDFPIVVNQFAASIFVDKSESNVVRIAANLLASDIERVSDVRPAIVNSLDGLNGPVVMIGSLESPPVADLVKRHKLGASALTGRWEAFAVRTITDPFPGVTTGLAIIGSDRRGAAYGATTVSRVIGVSPWEWWADVPVVHHDSLVLAAGAGLTECPAVRYRGIFLNDEDWGLEPWAAKTFEPGVGNIGPKTYAKIFELMLRLRANTIWPAMHPCTKPFFQVPGNADAADAYAIVVGSSHAEPMLRDNVGEWTDAKERYNYLTNRDGVLAYWEQRVKQRTSGESLFTLGMRGIHDSPMVGPKNQSERIATLEKIFNDQRDLLSRYLGHGDLTKVGQIFVPYKEVLPDYEAGLRVPDDVTIVAPDDNFGYIRRFPTPDERGRSGGYGVYYHLSYLGAPLSWLWLDSLPPALVWSEMMKAYEQGVRAFWIANVGDLKANERSTEFFLDLAWNADRTAPEAPARFLHDTAVRDFGSDHADAIASILARHQALAFSRKPEHLQWQLPGQPYAPTTLTVEEITGRLDAYAALERDAKAVAAKLPANAQDAFFELVGYPVAAAAASNEHYFRAELARLQKASGAGAEAVETFAASGRAERRIEDLTAAYNNDIAGGKWRGVVTANGLDRSIWKSFQPDRPLPAIDSSAQASVHPPPVVPRSKPPVIPVGAHPGDFVEQDGVISMNAGHFTGHTDLASGAGWRVVPGLGRSGSAVTVLPTSAAMTADNTPRLDYRFYVWAHAAAKLLVRLLPTYPLVSGRGLRFAVAIDDGSPQAFAVTSGFDPTKDEWKHRVLANATEVSGLLPTPLSAGWHTLHLVGVEAGVEVDKIVIDLGGLTPSYDGPPETRVP